MEKAIEIKRRAQRCLQSNDLDGAISEYEKLTRAEDSEPINFVLLADLFYKKGDPPEAAQRYLKAVDAYERAGLYKNAIAVCKKMARLSLSPIQILHRLAQLHTLDGFTTEAALYHQQYAEHQVRAENYRDAAESLRQAFEVCPENAVVLERASEALGLAGDVAEAAAVLVQAAEHHSRAGRHDEAARLRARAEELHPGAGAEYEARQAAAAQPTPSSPAVVPAEEEGEVAGLEQRAGFAPPDRLPDPAEEPAVGDFPAPLAGVRFEGPAGVAGPAAEGMEDEVERLLARAAESFRAGEREAASDMLVQAARSYESHGRHDDAAAIYRSLGRGAQAPPEVIGLWLRNCELRSDSPEAADVACMLGDRALNEGDTESAREWFARALRHLPDHDLANRRLQRLGPQAAGDEPGNGVPAGEGSGKVEVAVGRAQAVTLDLGSLISEFQRGIESQLSGDAQSHYDLGMTYREMGLLEQAVSCFRAAGRDPAFAQRSAEMMGRTLLDEGRFDAAVEEFERGLEALQGQPEAALGMRFLLGLAHEAAGHTRAALAEFEGVYAMQPNHPDVAQKIRVLRRTLESV